MLQVADGQCGRCADYGEDDTQDDVLVQIRVRGVAPEGYTDACGHPELAGMRLHVSANSGCAGFSPLEAA